jgi:hypothetical protein
LTKPRAGDRLKVLIQANAITEQQYEAWKKLRNRSAHGNQNDGLSHQKFMNLLTEVEVLFYHLIFHAIRYKGLYVDYSAAGWTTKEYPPKLPSN